MPPEQIPYITSKKGGFLGFLKNFIQHCFIYRLSVFIVYKYIPYARIEQGLLALAVRCSSYSTRFHPLSARIPPQRISSHPHSVRSHPQCKIINELRADNFYSMRNLILLITLTQGPMLSAPQQLSMRKDSSVRYYVWPKSLAFYLWKR
jgi:hypothetical protein